MHFFPPPILLETPKAKKKLLRSVFSRNLGSTKTFRNRALEDSELWRLLHLGRTLPPLPYLSFYYLPPHLPAIQRAPHICCNARPRQRSRTKLSSKFPSLKVKFRLSGHTFWLRKTRQGISEASALVDVSAISRSLVRAQDRSERVKFLSAAPKRVRERVRERSA